MGTLKNNYKFNDILRAPSQSQFTLVSDENAYNFNPNRYAFYMHFINGLNDPNESLIPSILNIINTSKLTLRQYAERVNDIMKSLKFAVKKQQNEEEHIRKINILLRSNPLTSSYYIKLRKEENKDIPLVPGVPGAPGAKPAPAAAPGAVVAVPAAAPATPSSPAAPGAEGSPAAIEPESSKKIKVFEQHLGTYIYVGIPYFEHAIDPIEEKLTYNKLNQTLNDDKLKIIENKKITPPIVEEIYNKLKGKEEDISGIALNKKTNTLDDENNVIIYKKATVNVVTHTGGNGNRNRHSLLQLGGEAITYYSTLNKKLNDLEMGDEKPTSDRLINIGKDDKIREVVKDYEDDPIFGVDTEKITPTDRAIFIALTYIIRSISLFLLNWSINSNMVKNFENAFILYFVSYICIFIIIVILVNTENNLFFRMLLYYLDSKNNGWGRILIHILIQLGLMPIIWMLKISSESMKITDFTTSQRLYGVIADYTFFIWLFSSIIALQY